MRIGVGAVWAAAGPGMAAAVDEPLLNDHPPVLSRVTVRVCARSAACRASARSMLSPAFAASTMSCGVRRMDDVVRVAMEDDGANAGAVVRQPRAISVTGGLAARIATHGRER